MPDLDAKSSEKIDALVIAAPSKQCDTFDPTAFGLTAEMAQKVQMVISGDKCLVQMPDPTCTPEQQAAFNKSISQLRFDGTVLVMGKDGNTYSLADGKAIFKSVIECNKMPDVDFRAIGVQIKPTGLNDAEVMAQIEQGNFGQFLARIHIFAGEAEVYSIDGDIFMHLYAGDQVLLDPESLQVLEAFNAAQAGFNRPDTDSDSDAGYLTSSDSDASVLSGTKNVVGAPDAGCNTSAKNTIHPDAMGAICSMVFAMVLAARYKEKVKGSLADMLKFATKLKPGK